MSKLGKDIIAGLQEAQAHVRSGHQPSKELEAAARVMAETAWDEGMAYKAHVNSAERAQWVDKHWRDMLDPLRAAISDLLLDPTTELLEVVLDTMLLPPVERACPPEVVLRAIAHHVLGEDE